MVLSLACHAGKTTAKEIRSAPCGYCLGVCSVCLVVVVAAVVYSLIAVAPLIFLREAEVKFGQTDTLLSSPLLSSAGRETANGNENSNSNSVGDANTAQGTLYLNYTRFAQSLAEAPAPYNSRYAYHAPRITLSSAGVWKATACAESAALQRLQPDNISMLYYHEGISCGSGTCLLRLCAGDDLLTDDADGDGAVADSTIISTTTSTSSTTSTQTATVSGVQLLAIDSSREAFSGIGRKWPFTSTLLAGSGGSVGSNGRMLSRDPTSEHTQQRELQGGDTDFRVIVPTQLAKRMGGCQVGDVLYARLHVPDLLSAAFATQPDNVAWPYLVRAHPYVAARLVVAGVGDGVYGKLGNSAATTTMFMEYADVTSLLSSYMHPVLQQTRKKVATGQPNMYDFAHQIVANLPPSTRLKSYASNNYDRLRAAIADHSSTMLYLAGYTEVAADSPLLSDLEPRRFITLYLGLVLDVLLIILFVLSVILVYSLLLVNAESRQFELAIRRMLGTRRTGIILLLSSQAAAYGLPAWVCGLIVAQVIAAVVLRGFSNISSIPVEARLTSQSIIAATVLALAIPAVSAIGPIRGALKRNIREALDSDRPKATAIKYSLRRSNDGKISTPTIVVGVCLTCFGFALYYLLPLALLSSNLSLFFNLFLAIILGMLAGLVLLALNLELLLLRATGLLTLAWWEKSAVWKILMSNITAGHRKRNRKTIIMYALSIAFIVFISVAATAQIQSATYSQQSAQGARITIGNEEARQPPDPGLLLAFENGLRTLPSAAGYVVSAWGSMRLDAALQSISTSSMAAAVNASDGVYITETTIRNVGRTVKNTVSLYAVAPSLYGLRTSGLYESRTVPGATFEDFLQVEKGPSPDKAGLPLSALLYTTAGSEQLMISNSLTFDLKAAVDTDLIIQSKSDIQGDASSFPMYSRSRLQTAATLAGAPGFPVTRGPSNANTAFTSFPTLVRMLDQHMGYSSVGLPRVGTSALSHAWAQQAMFIMDRTDSVEVREGLSAALHGNHTWIQSLIRSWNADGHEQPFRSDVQSSISMALLLYASSLPAGAGEPAAVFQAGIGGVSFADMPLRLLFINAGKTSTIQSLLTSSLSQVFAGRIQSGYTSGFVTGKDSIWSGRDSATKTEVDTTVILLELFFAVLALVAMVLCFFSLMASMITNITEQRREIGVMLALGLRSYDLVRIYVEEAFLLVLASSILGVVIGCVIAWTFGQQQSLFTSIPTPFIVPWGILCVIFLASVALSILAACTPARRLVKQPITALLRG